MLPNPVRRVWTATARLGMTRLGLVLATVSGSWLMTYFGFAVEPAGRRNPALGELGLGATLLASGGAALGLAVCAVALNDLLDRRHDRVLGETAAGGDKPVASGEVSPRAAAVVAVGSLLVAVLAAGALGPTSLKLAVLLGAGVLFYNVAGRFVPAVGIVTLGLLQGLALAIPNPEAGFAWPVLLTMSHVMGCGLVGHVLENKRPRLRARDVWGVLLGWGFWSLTVLLLIGYRRPPGNTPAPGITPPPEITPAAGSTPIFGNVTLNMDAGVIKPADLTWVWVGPAAAVLGFLLVTGWTLARNADESVVLPNRMKSRRQERFVVILGLGRARRFRRLSVGWLIVYDAAWLWSAGLWWQGATVLGLLALVILAARESHLHQSPREPARQRPRDRFIGELTNR